MWKIRFHLRSSSVVVTTKADVNSSLLFLFQANPCNHPIVFFQNVSSKYVEHLLSFIYKGEVEVTPEDLPGFLKLAEVLDIKGVRESQQVPNKHIRHTTLHCHIPIGRVRGGYNHAQHCYRKFCQQLKKQNNKDVNREKSIRRDL